MDVGFSNFRFMISSANMHLWGVPVCEYRTLVPFVYSFNSFFFNVYKLTMMPALEKVCLRKSSSFGSLRGSPEDISHGVDLIKQKYAECYDFERN